MSTRTPLVPWIGIAVGVRLAAILAYLRSHDWRPETWDYHNVTLSLLRGEGLSHVYNGAVYRSDYVPVFPLITAGLHWLFGPSFVAFYVFQLSCAAVIVWLTYRIALKFFGGTAAAIAAALVAVDPGLIVHQSYKVNVEAFSTVLILEAVVASYRLLEEDRDGAAIKLGAIIGLSALTRPDLVSLLALPVMLQLRAGVRLQAVRRLLIVAGVIGAFLLPWGFRNHTIHGRFIWTTSTAAQNLWIGNNPNSTVSLWVADGRSHFDSLSAADKAEVFGKGEIQNMDFFSSRARKFIVDNPALTVGRAFKRFGSAWWHHPSGGSSLAYGWAPDALEPAFICWTFLIFALALAGTVSAWRNCVKGPMALWAPLVAMAAIHAPYYVEGRHRAIVFPLLITLAANAVSLRPVDRWPLLGRNP